MYETPQISNTYYGSNTTPIEALKDLQEQSVLTVAADAHNPARLNFHRVNEADLNEEEVQMSERRIVQVFIADTDKNVPLEKSVLYTGNQKLTDSTDQELYFEIDIRGIVNKHNEYRKKIIDKKASIRAGKDIYLEPIKIRDLKMVVVTVAEF